MWPRSFQAAVVIALSLAIVLCDGAVVPRPRVTVGPNAWVSAIAPEAQFVEPCVAADPKDSRHLIAASGASTNPSHEYTVAAFCSFDSGANWMRSNLDVLDQLTFVLALDVWVAFAGDGTAYLSCLVSGDITVVLVFRSTDGGRSWTRAGTIPRRGRDSFDRPSIVTDSSGGSFSGSIYVLSEESFLNENGIDTMRPIISRSTDRGASFSEPLRIEMDNDTGGMPSGEVVLSDGTVILAYISFPRDADGGGPRHIWVRRSIDGCRTLSESHSVAEVMFPIPGSYPEGAPNVMLAADFDSARFKNRIYLVWTDSRGGGTDVYVSYSSDKGQHWSHPVKVNDNSNPKVDQATPVIAVNRNGVVGVAWQDRRDDPANQCSTVYFSGSVDGGRSFLVNTKVSSARSCTSQDQNLPPETMAAHSRWRTGGDYMGICATTDRAFHIVWSDAHTSRYQLWSAAVTIGVK